MAARSTARTAQRNVTLMDVARAAGVGKSTVSNVLNGSGRVGEAARARVLEMVDQLGYRRMSARAACGPAGRCSWPASCHDPARSRANLIMMQFMQSLLRPGRGSTTGCSWSLRTPTSDDIRSLVAGRIVDGFVLCELQPDDRRAELLAELGVPFACFGRTRPGLPQPWADIDNAEAEAQAVQHVIERGYTRPAYIGYAAETYWDADREAGFRVGLARCGIPGDGAGVVRVSDDASARAQIRSFLASARPDAVLTGSDKIAVIVYSIAAELNLCAGRDLAVMGFDGSVGAGLLRPPLTTWSSPSRTSPGVSSARCYGRSRTARTLSRERSSRPGCAEEKASRSTANGRVRSPPAGMPNCRCHHAPGAHRHRGAAGWPSELGQLGRR